MKTRMITGLSSWFDRMINRGPGTQGAQGPWSPGVPGPWSPGVPGPWSPGVPGPWSPGVPEPRRPRAQGPWSPCVPGPYPGTPKGEKKQFFLSVVFASFFREIPMRQIPSQPDFDETITFDTDFPARARIFSSRGDSGRSVLRFLRK